MFLEMAVHVNVDHQLRCAYFKTIYVDMQYCFLCLRLKQTDERLVETWCCQSTIYAACVSTVRSRLLKNCRLITLACGRTTWRGCNWTAQYSRTKEDGIKRNSERQQYTGSFESQQMSKRIETK